VDELQKTSEGLNGSRRLEICLMPSHRLNNMVTN